MAVLGTALAKELLGFDDANKAFRPWWDTTQDFLMYGMVVLGMNALLKNVSRLHRKRKNINIEIPFRTIYLHNPITFFQD